jgi:mRNA interferase RelE/StbE
LNRYNLFETRGFIKDLETINIPSAKGMLKKLHSFVYPSLRQEPHFGPNIKKLKGFHPDTWRYRIGDWRFFYEIDEKEKIVFLTAAHHWRLKTRTQGQSLGE